MAIDVRQAGRGVTDGAGTRMRLGRAMLELLRSEGVDRVFGNPGTTELPLMDELDRDGEVEYVLGLQEGSVVAMADGYARASRRPAFVSLHVVAGTANGLIGLHNARRSRTPLVVAAGQQDRRHLDQGPMLAGEIAGMAAPACKWATEVHHGPDLLQVLRRAFLAAQAPPSGPVLVSIPMDVLMEELEGEVPAPSEVPEPGPAGGIDRAAAELAAAGRPAIVAGDAIGREDAVGEAVALAEALGATVYLQPMYDAVDFPATHPLCAGALQPSNAEIHETLARHDVVLIAGAHAFAPHYYSRREAVPRAVRLLQLDSDAAEVGRNHAVVVGLVGGMRATLGALAEALAGRVGEAPERLARARERQASAADDDERETLALYEGRPIAPEAAAHAIARALPADAIVVEEAITFGPHLRRFLRPERPGSFHHTVGGGLGWGIGAAIGVKLARPERPVVAVVGDGSAMYGVQGLWSAARHGAPAVFVVCDNGEYRVLKQGLDALEGTPPRAAYTGMDLAPPAIDWVGLARSLGVAAIRVEAAEKVGDALPAAIASGRPTLIDLHVAPKPAA